MRAGNELSRMDRQQETPGATEGWTNLLPCACTFKIVFLCHRAEAGEDLDDDDEDVSLEAPFPPDFEIRFDRHRRLSESDSETETEDNLLGASDGTPFDPAFWERRFEDEEEESVTRVTGENAEESDFRPNEAPPPPNGPPPPPPPPPPQSLGAIPRLSR